MLDFSYKFPENFTGHIVVNQNNIIKKNTSRSLCSIILTKIAKQNDWKAEIPLEEIKKTTKKDIIKPIADLTNLNIVELIQKEGEWFIVAKPKLVEIMERFSLIVN